MIKTASTREIIEYLETYEKIHGVGSVESIGSVCSGARDVEYIFYIKDEFKHEVKVEIPSIDREELFKNKRIYGGVTMTKEKFKEIMKQNCILDCDVEDAIYFVRDLLESQADELKVNEPYATKSIDRLEEAAREVGDLLYDLADVMEG